MTGVAASDRAASGAWAGLAWAAVALVLSGLIVAAVLWWLLPRLYPEVTLGAGRALEIQGSRFAVPEGRGATRVRDATRVRALEEQRVVFVTRVFLPAAQAPVLRLALSGGHPDLVTELYWLAADAPDEPRFLRLHRGDAAVTRHRLGGREGWSGQIVELGVVLSGMHAIEPVRLESVAFEPARRTALARLLWQQWRLLQPWRLGSTNHYRGVPEGAPLPPTPVAAAWALGALLVLATVARLRRWRFSTTLPPVMAAVMAPWLALDGLWQARLAEQLNATQARFGDMSQSEKRAMQDDALLQREAATVLDALAPVRGKRLFLLRDAVGHDYHRLRLQHHLLPLDVYNFGTTLPDPNDVRAGDHLALLDDPAAVRFDPRREVLTDGQVTLPAEPVLAGQRVALYRLESPGR